MAITIENPTAEAIFEALKQVPADEVNRLREMLNEPATEDEEEAWYQASRAAAARFTWSEEDL